jgi:hypothetical protein
LLGENADKDDGNPLELVVGVSSTTTMLADFPTTVFGFSGFIRGSPFEFAWRHGPSALESFEILVGIRHLFPERS